MSLVKWAVGLIVFQMLIVVFLIGIAPMYAEATYDSSDISTGDINSSQTFDNSDLGILESFTYTVSSFSWYVDFILLIPSIVSGILVLLYIRGVN